MGCEQDIFHLHSSGTVAHLEHAAAWAESLQNSIATALLETDISSRSECHTGSNTETRLTKEDIAETESPA